MDSLQWDDVLPTHLQIEWKNLHADICKLRNFTIPRSITSNPLQTLEIHVFSDASEKAYAAAVYSKAVDSLQNVSVHLLMSKTKVAPVKTISMPRLELCLQQRMTSCNAHYGGKDLFGYSETRHTGPNLIFRKRTFLKENNSRLSHQNTRQKLYLQHRATKPARY